MSGRRLIDVETSHHADLIINQSTIDTYKQRLERLQEGLTIACRRAHASFIPLNANRGLDGACREELTAAEILRPV